MKVNLYFNLWSWDTGGRVWMWRIWWRKSPSWHKRRVPQDWTDYLLRVGPFAVRLSFPTRTEASP